MVILAEHLGALDKRLAKHLLRRACFQYSKSQLDQMIGKTPSEIIDAISISKTYSWMWPNDPITNNANTNCADIQDGYWLNNSNWNYFSYM